MADKKDTPKKVDNVELNPDEEKFLQANLGNRGKQELKAVMGRTDEDVTLQTSDFTPAATVYFKNCKRGKYVVDAPSTKILIEGCEECTFTLNRSVKTEVVEVWKCNSCTVNLNVPGKTLQADLCRTLNLNFQHRRFLKQIVWAGVYGLSINYADGSFETGFEQMLKEYPDINDQTDQFIFRLTKDGKPLHEQLVRLNNGYPTTEREAKAFEERQERDNAKFEEHVRKMMKFRGTAGKVGAGAKQEKVGRNDPCPCKSAKKYKKCCGTPEAQERIKAEREAKAAEFAAELKAEEKAKEEALEKIEAKVKEERAKEEASSDSKEESS